MATGKNPITGEDVSDPERALTAGMLFVPSALAGSVKVVSKLAKGLKGIIKNRGKSSKLAQKLLNKFGKNSNNEFVADKLIDSARKLGLKNADEISDINKIANGGKKGGNLKLSKNIDDYAEAAAKKIGPKLPDKIADTFKEGKYYNRQLKTDEIFYKYHGIDNRTGKKITWVVKKIYKNEDELRKGLAILPEWGTVIAKKSEFKVPKGTWVSEGLASSQKLVNKLPGGDYQGVIQNVPKKWILNTTEAFK